MITILLRFRAKKRSSEPVHSYCVTLICPVNGLLSVVVSASFYHLFFMREGHLRFNPKAKNMSLNPEERGNSQ